MIHITLPYKQLQLIPYEGAGNRTPVLNLNSIEGIAKYDPAEVRSFLEKDLPFRTWLQNEGKKLNADTIMLYYTRHTQDYDFVTFVAEPNTALENGFSEMCGNGIRSLALHIFNETGKKHANIWAGSVRVTDIIESDAKNNTAEVRVNLGTFHNNLKDLSSFMQVTKVAYHTDSQSFTLPPSLKCSETLGVNPAFSIGCNGDTPSASEPHLVTLFTWDEFMHVMQKNNKLTDQENKAEITQFLQHLVSVIGKDITFAYDIFPLGINVNIGVIIDDAIFMATHERNINPNKEICLQEIAQSNRCHCNTLACGTGGAVVANIAKQNGFLSSNTITTVQPGGKVSYEITNETTFMIGPAKRTK